MPGTGDSKYDDQASITRAVAEGRHREIVGGLWVEVGTLQFEFLRSHGLCPDDYLIDIGCGSLRGGVYFSAYLRPGHYWGVDQNNSLLEAGWSELAKLDLTNRVPRTNLRHDDEFDFKQFGQTFDVAVALSLFTHLSANRIRLCLYRLAKVMRPGGRLFATYFEAPQEHSIDEPCFHVKGGRRTYGHKDPFHYRLSDLEAMGIELRWSIAWAGDWDHPRGQKMVIFERLPDTQTGENPG